MTKHIKRDLDQIERGILEVGALVEQSIQNAIVALIMNKPELAQQVVEMDEEIDRREVELEEDCLKVLALHQPVAGDLRFIIAVIKVNSTLERMGDLSCNIARLSSDMAGSDFQASLKLDLISEQVRNMVRLSLDALVKLDAGQARHILTLDDEVDDETDAALSSIAELSRNRNEIQQDAISALLVSRHLERIADLATNIAEDVVFMVEGEIIRHHSVEAAP